MKRALVLLPGAVPIVLAVVVAGLVADSPGTATKLETYVSVVVIAGALLGVAFRRALPALASLCLIAAHLGVQQLGGDAGGPSEAAHFTSNAVAFLLPLNLAMLALARERGVLAPATLVRLGALIVQPLLVAFIWLSYNPVVAAFLDQRGWSADTGGWLQVTDATMVAAGTALVITLAAALFNPEPVQASLVWAVVATFLSSNEATFPARSLLFLLAAGLALTIAVVQTVFALAFRDALTGLPNRRALEEALGRVEGRCVAAMIDVDHFKDFNDRYGHAVGDQVLRMVATRLGKIPGGGQAFRYGGEEFTVLMQGRTLDDAVLVLDALRLEIGACRFALRGPDRPKSKPPSPSQRKGKAGIVKLTVSIGVAERRDSSTKANDVLKAADAALYRAKNGGRNQVCT